MRKVLLGKCAKRNNLAWQDMEKYLKKLESGWTVSGEVSGAWVNASARMHGVFDCESAAAYEVYSTWHNSALACCWWRCVRYHRAIA